MALSCGLLRSVSFLTWAQTPAPGGATVRLERERISKVSLGTTLGMSCDGRDDCLPAVRVASAAAWNRMATVISLREVIVTAKEEVRRLAEEPEESQDNLPGWQREMVRKVRAMLASSRCLQLPGPLQDSSVVYYE